MSFGDLSHEDRGYPHGLSSLSMPNGSIVAVPHTRDSSPFSKLSVIFACEVLEAHSRRRKPPRKSWSQEWIESWDGPPK